MHQTSDYGQIQTAAIFCGTFVVSYFVMKLIRGDGRKRLPSLPYVPLLGSLPFLPNIVELPAFYMMKAKLIGSTFGVYLGSR